MNNDELIEYAIRTSKVIKEEIKPKLIDYFYKQREVIDKAIEYINENLIISSILDGKKTYCLNNYTFDYKELLDILQEVSE